MKTRFKKDINLDAQMVYAGMKNRFEPYAVSIGMKPDEAFGRAEWLKKQSRQYIHAVTLQVRKLQVDSISDFLTKPKSSLLGKGENQEK